MVTTRCGWAFSFPGLNSTHRGSSSFPIMVPKSSTTHRSSHLTPLPPSSSPLPPSSSLLLPPGGALPPSNPPCSLLCFSLSRVPRLSSPSWWLILTGCCSCCCPCVVAGQNAEIISEGMTSEWVSEWVSKWVSESLSEWVRPAMRLCPTQWANIVSSRHDMPWLVVSPASRFGRGLLRLLLAWLLPIRRLSLLPGWVGTASGWARCYPQ